MLKPQNSFWNAMKTQTVIKLNREKRASIMVSEEAKARFDRYKDGLYDWQLFDRLLDIYESEMLQAQESKAA